VEVISIIEALEIYPQIELMGEEITTAKLEVEPLVLYNLRLQNYNKGDKCLQGYKNLISFNYFTRISRMELKYKGGNV
jgi:hypothetical protein